jgi:hypothetical protein
MKCSGYFLFYCTVARQGWICTQYQKKYWQYRELKGVDLWSISNKAYLLNNIYAAAL